MARLLQPITPSLKNLVLLAGLLSGCLSEPAPSGPLMGSPAPIPHDPHSFGEPNRARVRHVELDLALDFDAARVQGTARLDLERGDPDAPLTLDSLGLRVRSVTGADGGERPFRFGDEVPKLGRPLVIELAPADDAVTIAYETSPGAEALQWLAPEQTAGGQHPFLFTQGQSILTRSWIPLQDSPGVRVTYGARVRAPEPLTVVMSAERRARGADGAFRFALELPIPPYLIALACGELASRDVSARCAIWAEPSMLERAHHEFAETEAMIRSAERLFGPYRWGRYDMIVLPPAFPFGGMENPLLTFLTPTAIAGDRSLTSLIAHELAHSWSGNLVTNATWRDFWLNEGTTVYFEQRIVEEIYGPERVAMERRLALDALAKAMARMEPWETVLHVDLAGKHPDDGFSSVPYDKGALFLLRLEEAVGRESFDRFLRAWFDGHAFRSVTTADFQAFLERELVAREPALAAVDVDRWLYGPGLPDDVPRIESDAFELVEAELDRWRAGTAATDLATDGWVTQQWLHFLARLPDPLTAAQLAELDQAFGFTRSGNSEILSAWLVLTIRDGHAPAAARLEEFLLTVGRRKFLEPLYKELVKTEAGRERARRIYERARPRYHAVSSGTLDEVVYGAR